MISKAICFHARVAMTRWAKQNVNAWFVVASLLVVANQLHAQGTAFTYQGRLQSGTNVANGSYDLTFSVWNNSVGPSQVGNTFTNVATSVANGLFTVTLDCGTGIFDGNPRWLEIGVRTNGSGAFTTLSPRQPLTASPYAIYAGGVSATGISGTIPAGNIAAGTITSNMLAAGAAAANLAVSGQAAVPSGGVVLSSSDSDTNLIATGYTKIGGYVSAPNLWQQRATSPALAGRGGHAAVWTGSKMIVWGGYCGNESPSSQFSDGGCYDPISDSWIAVSTNGAPLGRVSFTTVWTGSEMIIWSGYTFYTVYNFFNDGSRYNPVSVNWAAVTTNNAPSPRSKHTAVWTGTEMIVWGGFFATGAGFQYSVLADGARYNPVLNTWTQMTTNGAPTARFDHTAVWTGSEMIVWGGQNGNGSGLNDGKRYNPVTDTWSPMSSTNVLPGRSRHTAVWTGSEMIVWGGFSGGGPYEQSGGRYNPATDSWSVTDNTFAPTGRVKHSALWTGREMIVWGGECANPVPQCNDGGSYDPVSNTWTPVTTAPRAPTWRVDHSAVWTGNDMIIFGGFGGAGCSSDTWSCTAPKLLYLYLKP
ncbi:MAG: kelch repeat-containing protein [Verrucomicrobiales bacterium]|nr:kelch repeat-containing protein [Verrucomicrobiales bacterium]